MSPTVTHRDLIQRLFEIEALQFGSYAEVRDPSPFYMDLRVVISHPDVLARIGALMAEAERHCRADRIASIPTRVYRSRWRPAWPAASPRVPAPRIEATAPSGASRRLHPGEHVVVIDDIITDGASKFEAIERWSPRGWWCGIWSSSSTASRGAASASRRRVTRCTPS